MELYLLQSNLWCENITVRVNIHDQCGHHDPNSKPESWAAYAHIGSHHWRRLKQHFQGGKEISILDEWKQPSPDEMRRIQEDDRIQSERGSVERSETLSL